MEFSKLDTKGISTRADLYEDSGDFFLERRETADSLWDSMRRTRIHFTELRRVLRGSGVDMSPEARAEVDALVREVFGSQNATASKLKDLDEVI